jgi:hypothetical protein
VTLVIAVVILTTVRLLLLAVPLQLAQEDDQKMKGTKLSRQRYDVIHTLA